jgi:hypothetical protein
MAAYRKPLPYRKAHPYRGLTGPQEILPGGIASPAFSTHAIALKRRFVYPSTISPDSLLYPDVSHWIRYLDLAGQGISQAAFGTADVSYENRTIDVPFIFGTSFGTAIVRRRLEIAPSGWASSTVGIPDDVVINTRRLYPIEFQSSTIGASIIRNEYEFVVPTGWFSEQINFPVVYNETQVLTQLPFNDYTNPEVFGPTLIENRNRTVRPFGHRDSRFSNSTFFENAAAPITPAGLDATSWGTTRVEHENRTLAAQGWDSFYTTQWHVVYNDAVLLAPNGIAPASAVGRPDPVANLDRTFTHYFPYEGESFGTAFIAYAIRTLVQGAYLEGPNGIPEVRLNPYPIAPTSIEPQQVGGHYLFERFNIVAPTSFNVYPADRIGEASFANRNRVVATHGYNHAEYGRATVENYIRYISVPATVEMAFGSHLVAYRTKIMVVAAISAPSISVIHEIRNLIPDPPGQQTLLPDGWASSLVGDVAVNSQTLFPSGFRHDAYGVATLTANTIRITRGIQPDDLIGTPLMVFTQYAYPQQIPEFDELGDSDMYSAKPHLSPYTIYAPSSDQATQQAAINNPSEGEPHRIDAGLANVGGAGSISYGGGWPWFGYPSVSTSPRYLAPFNFTSSYVSPAAAVENRRRYVRPIPMMTMRFGVVTFLNVPQYVSLDTVSLGISSTIAFGEADVAPPYVETTPVITPNGLESSTFGTTSIENFHRTLSLTGIPHRGNPENAPPMLASSTVSVTCTRKGSNPCP